MTTFHVVINERHIVYLIEDLGINLCRGLPDSPKHTDSQWKTLSMCQVPVGQLCNATYQISSIRPKKKILNIFLCISMVWTHDPWDGAILAPETFFEQTLLIL